jgi:HEAT repeat protein
VVPPTLPLSEEISMPRPLTALILLAILLSAAQVRGADDEPRYKDKSLSEWLTILEGSRDIGQRRLSLQALGTGADHSLVWRQMTNNRQAALLIVEVVFGPAKSKKILPVMVGALLNDPEEVVRAGAAQGLGRISVKCKMEKQDFTPARDAILGALRKDPSGAVREAAANALAKLEPADVRSAIPTLIERLKDDHPGTRAAAADTLRRLGRDAVEAVSALREAVEDTKNEPLTRFQAAQALGRIGPPEAAAALPGLQKVLTDEKTPQEVRLAIIEVVGKFGKDSGPAVPLLGKLLSEDDSPVEVRSAAVTALEELGPGSYAAWHCASSPRWARAWVPTSRKWSSCCVRGRTTRCWKSASPRSRRSATSTRKRGRSA